MAFSDMKMEEILSEFAKDKTQDEKDELIKCVVTKGTKDEVQQMMDLCAGDDNVKNKALFYAAQEGKLELVRYLVSEGADVNFRDEVIPVEDPDHQSMFRTPRVPDKEVTPLMLSADNNFTKCMKILIEAGADVNAVDSQGRTALLRIITEGNLAVVNQLIEAGTDVNIVDNEEYTALFKAVDRILPDCVSALIQAGADVNIVNRYGTALIWVMRIPELNYRYLNKEELRLQANLEMISSLLGAGADVNVVNARGETPLFLAGAGSQVEAVDQLIEAGADVNIANMFGDTILKMIAATSVHRNVKLVLKAGAHVNITNDDGQNALDYCLKWGVIDKKIIMILFAAGETLNVSTEATSFETTGKHPVPEYLLQTEQSLKAVCREAIRKHLVELSPVNLFCRVPQLGLPSVVAEYLLYHRTIEPEDDDSVTMDRSLFEPVY